MSRNAARMAVPQYAVGPKQQALDFADFVMIGEKLRHVPLKRKVDAHADTIELLGKEDGPSPSKRRRTALGSDLETTREQYFRRENVVLAQKNSTLEERLDELRSMRVKPMNDMDKKHEEFTRRHTAIVTKLKKKKRNMARRMQRQLEKERETTNAVIERLKYTSKKFMSAYAAAEEYHREVISLDDLLR